MRTALFDKRAQTGRMLITVRSDDGTSAEWRADYLQQRRADGGYTLMAMREPEGVAGVALLTRSSVEDSRAWMYVPSVRRTRELDALEADTRFLFSDITYGDLGMFERRASELHVSSVDGGDAFLIERVPADSWQISRIKTWLSQDNALPLRREFYDRAGRLWKEASFTHGEVQGTPTIVGITMRDVQGGGETRITRRDITYVDEVNEALFAPDELWRAGQRELIQGGHRLRDDPT
jgi:outer membrane lipoprotein-sorting protein